MLYSTKSFIIPGLIAVVGAIALVPAMAGKDKDKDKKADGGMTCLFNGKDLTGWHSAGNWVVEDDGTLAIKPREGEEGWKRFDAYLWADKQYGDFVFEFEYKHPEGGNSGFFFRVGDEASPVDTGFEVQILDSLGKKEPLGHHDLGGIIKTVGPTKNMAKPAGEWNKMKVTAKGNNVKVELNGKQIVDVDVSEYTPAKDKPLKGSLGLQDHGQVMWFRNIRGKEL